MDLRTPGPIPYSHPLALQIILEYSSKIPFSTYCNQNTAELSRYHTLVGKGFLPVYDISENIEILICKNVYQITPAQLAYFFNHSSPYQEYLDTTRLNENHFGALFLK